MESVPSEKVAPVVKGQRIHSIDTLRGVALFGILLLNIIAFALPLGAYFNPIVDGATEGINLFTFVVVDTFFEGSMRTIFSMLFGASVILFTAKRASHSINIKSLYYRRTTLLILFGLIDAYLFLWVGDILYAYGMAGLVLYFFRNAAPIRLFSGGAVIIAIFAVINLIGNSELSELRNEVLAIESISEDSLTVEQQSTLAAWQALQGDNVELPAVNEEDIRIRKSGYLTIVAGLAPINLVLQTIDYVTHMFWDVLAMMLLGMAFFKWGIFDASRSSRFYLSMALIGLSVGLSVNFYENLRFIESGFATHLNVSALRPTYDIGRFFVALGYIGIVMLICKAGILSWLRSSLAAVGQMALTNYLSHTVICNTIFMGFGFGLVGELQRYQIYYIVFAIWIIQLIVSPLWLRHFRFGPVEWLWRSLTYGKKQPMKVNSTPTVQEAS
jgi:uncharacterized protein